MNTRHGVIVALAEGAFGMLLREGAQQRCIHGMPPDARCVGVNYDPSRRVLLVGFEHPSFPAIKDGERWPERFITYTVQENPLSMIYGVSILEVGSGHIALGERA